MTVFLRARTLTFAAIDSEPAENIFFAFSLTSRNAAVYKLLRWCSEKQNIILLEKIE